MLYIVYWYENIRSLITISRTNVSLEQLRLTSDSPNPELSSKASDAACLYTSYSKNYQQGNEWFWKQTPASGLNLRNRTLWRRTDILLQSRNKACLNMKYRLITCFPIGRPWRWTNVKYWNTDQKHHGSEWKMLLLFRAVIFISKQSTIIFWPCRGYFKSACHACQSIKSIFFSNKLHVSCVLYSSILTFSTSSKLTCKATVWL